MADESTGQQGHPPGTGAPDRRTGVGPVPVRGPGGRGTLFERVGGPGFFVRLVDAFYDAVETDPVLAPLYPADTSASRRDLAEFLMQYWGGPPVYSARKGHPRLRARHLHLRIGPAERDAWLARMTAAVEATTDDPEVAEALTTYFTDAAAFLQNRP